jgi:hypothetical protein
MIIDFLAQLFIKVFNDPGQIVAGLDTNKALSEIDREVGDYEDEKDPEEEADNQTGYGGLTAG